MGIEIERKFLVQGEAWRRPAPERLTQGYLNRDPARTVRVRVAGVAGAEQGFLTIKGRNSGATRAEFEYPVPLADAQALLALCEAPLIDKWRHRVKVGGLLWEVDEFLGDNAGLVVAEVELQHEAQVFERPAWLGPEVTEDPRYFNSALSRQPFSRW
jgi:CYTH domain-containing protein